MEVFKFEIHYYLKDNKHSMDALFKNKCEAELLAAAYEILNQFNINITIESEAIKEGGIREIWNFIGKNSAQFSVIGVLLTALFAYMAIPDSELTELEKEEKKLAILKLKKELNIESSEGIDKSIEDANKNQKLKVRTSNFYKKLSHSDEVEKVGFTILDSKQKPLMDERIVYKSEFSRFILPTNKLPVETIENAQIEIVAPVLKEGKAKWKGIFQDEYISFEMQDTMFKDSVLLKQISFKNGDYIVCVLEIHKEINEVGEIVVTNRLVKTVLDKIDNGELKETQSGKLYRREKELSSRQTSMDFDE